MFPQKVLEDWAMIARIEAERICETFRPAEVDVLINADEMFVKFYPEMSTYLLQNEQNGLAAQSKQTTKQV